MLRFLVVYYCADQSRHSREIEAASRCAAVVALFRALPEAVSAYVVSCA